MIIKAVTSKEMREIDRISIEEIGIPATVLMNNAGKSVAEFIEQNFNDNGVIIFCGSGNNGGDGFTAAYYLFNKGFRPVLYLSGKKDRVSETSKIFINLCESMNITIHEIDDSNISSVEIPKDHVVIDAILGTGFSGTPSGIPDRFIEFINSSDNTVISIDIPSGLSSDGESPAGNCINADYTITIGLPKISLVTHPGKSYCGELIIVDIGFPSSLTSNKKLNVTLINRELFNSFNLLSSGEDIHKGDKGHTLLIGGFKGMEGAAILTASAMFNTGCGLLTIATVNESREVIAGRIPEVMTYTLSDDPDSPELEEFIILKKIKSIIIGPGIGRTLYSEKIFINSLRIIERTGIKNVLIDGDGLYHLSVYLEDKKLPVNTEFIITPHFMEASRILKTDINILKNNRLQSCIEIAKYTGCITVLKGPSSIISDGDNSFINTTGNNGLATAGSGDVLSGITGSFMNRKIKTIEAAAAGVYIHGLTADIYSINSPASTMKASDIIKNIRTAIKTVTDKD